MKDGMILGVLQARMSSSRLPGKIMEPILGVPMLAHQIRRLRRSHRMDALVVATSDSPEDITVADLARAEGVHAFCGSLDDVLERMTAAAEPFAPSRVVRLTGDCPVTDWEIIDLVIEAGLAGDYDYCSNTITPTWPDGLDVEVIRFESLQQASREATSPVEREHVTPFIHGRPERFRLHNVANKVDLSDLRWTVDEPRDLAFIRDIYGACFPANPAFLTGDILALLNRRPEILAANAGIERNEGYRRAIERWKDQAGAAGNRVQ